MKRMAKTTTTKTKLKPTGKTNKEGNTKHENKILKIGEQKNQTTHNESKLEWRRGCQKNCLKERSTNEDRKGATKIEQRRKNKLIMLSQKGLMKAKKKHGILKGTQKKKNNKTEKLKRVLEKGFGG